MSYYPVLWRLHIFAWLPHGFGLLNWKKPPTKLAWMVCEDQFNQPDDSTFLHKEHENYWKQLRAASLLIPSSTPPRALHESGRRLTTWSHRRGQRAAERGGLTFLDSEGQRSSRDPVVLQGSLPAWQCFSLQDFNDEYIKHSWWSLRQGYPQYIFETCFSSQGLSFLRGLMVEEVPGIHVPGPRSPPTPPMVWPPSPLYCSSSRSIPVPTTSPATITAATTTTSNCQCCSPTTTATPPTTSAAAATSITAKC